MNGKADRLRVPATIVWTPLGTIAVFVAPPAGPSRCHIDMRAITTVLVIARKPISLRSVAYYYRRFTGENCDTISELHRKPQILRRKLRCDTGYFVPYMVAIIMSFVNSASVFGNVTLFRYTLFCTHLLQPLYLLWYLICVVKAHAGASQITLGSFIQGSFR